MRANHLIVMVKQPRLGRVKTRLGRDIGKVAATWWFRHQVSRLLQRLESPRWQLWLAITPERAINSPIWPAHLPRISQGTGDLGARMRRAINSVPRGPACLIGGDIPNVCQQHISEAFAQLGQKDAVFGPASDGGFWLTGFRRTRPLPPRLFQGARWSGPHALADSIASLDGASHALCARLDDVDTGADLKRIG